MGKDVKTAELEARFEETQDFKINSGIVNGLRQKMGLLSAGSEGVMVQENAEVIVSDLKKKDRDGACRWHTEPRTEDRKRMDIVASYVVFNYMWDQLGPMERALYRGGLDAYLAGDVSEAHMCFSDAADIYLAIRRTGAARGMSAGNGGKRPAVYG